MESQIKKRLPRENKNYKKGQKIGSLIYLFESGKGENGNRLATFRCDCGKEFITILSQVKTNKTKSCGCSRLRACAKLNYSDILEIKNLIWKEGKTLKFISEKFNVSLSAIWAIKVGRTYKHIK